MYNGAIAINQFLLVKTEGILYNNKLVRNKIALVQAIFYVTCCPLSRMFIVHLNLIIFKLSLGKLRLFTEAWGMGHYFMAQ